MMRLPFATHAPHTTAANIGLVRLAKFLDFGYCNKLSFVFGNYCLIMN
jgi:hypothetical protein